MMSNNYQSHDQSAIPQLAAALQAIPQDEKVEWLHAVRIAPDLVAKESDPAAFLRFCDWNIEAAARRLTVYWRMRTQVFGETRAFLPLLNDFSGNGALGQEELEVLRSRAYLQMPDSHSRAVGYCDRTRIPPNLRRRNDAKLKCIFYMLQQISMNEVSQSHLGASFMIRGLQMTDKENVARDVEEMLYKAFPLRVHAIHLLYVRQERSSFLESIVPLLMAHFGRFFSSKILVHNCESEEKLMDSLARHGILHDSVPPDFGGSAGTDGTVSSSHPVSVFDLGSHSLGSKDAGSGFQIDTTTRGLEHLQHPRDSTQSSLSLHQPASEVVDNNVLFTEMPAMASFGPEGNSPFEPRRFRSPSPGLQHGHGHSDDVMSEADAVPEGGTLEMAARGSESSLSNPIRSRSPSQQQEVATPCSNEDEDDPLLDIPFVETPGIHEQSITVLNDAMSGVRDEQAAFYIEAVRRAPEVVQSESSPLTYLQFEKFNVWAAAWRLASYWKHRVQYFGDRAFLPLTQINGGALWEEDLRTLATGSWFFLPADSRGRPVLCYDPSKHREGASNPSRIRVAMYFFSVLCHDYPAAMTEGCVILVFVPSRIASLSIFDDITRDATDIALDCFPIKGCETHVIYSPAPTASPLRSFTALVLPVLQRAIGRLLSHGRAHFHVGSTRDELVSTLASFGLLSKASLTAVASGGIIDDDFALWMKNRQSLEGERWTHEEQTRSPLLPPAVFQDNVETTEPIRTSSGNHQQPPLPLPALFEGASETSESVRIDSENHQHQKHPPLPPAGATSETSESVRIDSENHQHQKHPPPPPPAAAVVEGTAEMTERDRIQSEPRGASSPNAKDIDDAMVTMTASEKEFYLEALREVPTLVKKESDPVRFLKSENGNALAAARRLASYWRIRREIFNERWLLPLTQTTEGALDRRDLAVLQTGFLVQLPNDESGCSVVCFDGTRLENFSPPSPLRVFFYLWSVVSQNDLSQENGYVLLHSMTDPNFDQSCKDYLDLVMEAHPVRLKRLHILGCCPTDSASERDFLQSRASDLTKMFGCTSQEKVTVHACESLDGFADKLVGNEMTKDGLPKSFGGDWGLSDFVQWQELRVRCEFGLPIGIPDRETAARYLIPIPALPPRGSLTGEEKAERRRRFDVVNSRKKRERARIAVQLMQEQCSALRKEQGELLREGRELEELLQRAKKIVASESVHELSAANDDVDTLRRNWC